MKVSRVGLYGLPLGELGMRSKFDRSGLTSFRVLLASARSLQVENWIFRRRV